MPLKKIALFTAVLLIPSFVYFIMCPFAHSFTHGKCQQLIVIQQQFQKNNFQHKEFTSAPFWHASIFPFNLQAYHKAIVHSLQPSLEKKLATRLTLVKTTRLNI